MREFNKYHLALRMLIGIKHQLNIVVIGANDGKTNDPIYNFAMKRSSATTILLVEPNKPLIPYLQHNYSSHPSYQVSNCAIGKEGMLTLYAVKQEIWDRFQPSYAKGWPSYRAATGITSAIKSHVEKALEGSGLDPDGAIDTLKIPAKELKTLLVELKWPMPIDVLQIDAEGYDDIVIYNSNLSYTRPKLIYFESQNISTAKRKSLDKYLSKHGYKTYQMGGDSLALYYSNNLTAILFNFILSSHSVISVVFQSTRKRFRAIYGFLEKREKVS